MANLRDVLDALPSFERRLEARIDSKLGSKFSEFALEMNARYDALEARFDRLERLRDV